MSTNARDGRNTLYSRRQIEGLIADGRKIIIVDHKVLKVDAWLKYHPGGDKAILHMVGRDATDELNAYVQHLDVRSGIQLTLTCHLIGCTRPGRESKCIGIRLVS
jgi:hypothetical protein